MHILKSSGQTFHVDSHYTYIRSIGSGAYGVVISSLDTRSGTKCAIKKIPNAFNDEIDAKRILREIKILRVMRHENVIGISDMIRPDPSISRIKDYKDVYIVSELMETDLHRIIYSKQALTNEHVQYFLYQILRGLKYLHSANILHRDLKPSNLLVNGNCDLKICDLGLARGVLPEDDSPAAAGGVGSVVLTEYVVTRWYRAPEIMLACKDYTKAIDIWSVGCIFAELIARKPWLPGDDYIHQLTMISAKLGKPRSDELDFVKSDKAKRFMLGLPNTPTNNLRSYFPAADADALDLLSKMLQINPNSRCSVEEALAHPYLAALHNPDDEPVAGFDFDYSFEDEELDAVRLKELIWAEVGHFRPEVLPVPPR
jgi:mitogen-activated protein kinase 1/3